MLKINNRKIGTAGEDEAIAYLKAKDYKIINRNFRIRESEIDIIAKYDNYLIFIEVKKRYSTKHGLPQEAVTIHKQKQISKAALYYIAKNNISDINLRFDVIAILEVNNKINIEHLENAFEFIG